MKDKQKSLFSYPYAYCLEASTVELEQDRLRARSEYTTAKGLARCSTACSVRPRSTPGGCSGKDLEGTTQEMRS